MGIGALGLLIRHLLLLESRFGELESARLEEAFGVRHDLYDLHGAIVGLSESLDESSERLERTVALSHRLGSTEQRLGTLGLRLEAHATSLERIADEYERFGPDALAEELSVRDRDLNDRWESLRALVATVQEAADTTGREVERLEADLVSHRDLDGMWREIVAPVVQLAGDVSVGSGVLLRSEEDPESDGFRTHLITAWHVVRDIQGSLENLEEPVPVFLYAEDGKVERVEAELLVFDPKLDAALLVVHTEEPLRFGATPASRERLDEVRIFDPIYAVGCPLGNDPIPTPGEVATIRHRVDGESYWMINAPTYIGNSGGGIFDSSTHELLGIFSKIYTHGTLRPTIVPHMGLVTPLSAIYGWLEEQGFAYVVPDGATEDDDERLATAGF